MKKFIFTFVIALVASLTFIANAQVTYQKPQKADLETLCDGVVIYSNENQVYYLRLSPMESGIGDSGDLVNLGKTRNEAKESLKVISRMMNEANKGENIIINGEKYTVDIVEEWEREFYQEYSKVAKMMMTNSRIKKEMVKYLEFSPEFNYLPARVSLKRIEYAISAL